MCHFQLSLFMRLLPLMLAFFLTASLAWGAAEPIIPAATNTRVKNVIMTASKQLGDSFVVLGSWISAKNYADPLNGGKSDHDLRLLLPKSTDEKVALQKWQEARDTVQQLVKQEFGKDADEVLKTMNLYPPNQLMNGVADAEDAYERFQKLGAVPALSHSGAVTEEVGEKLAEGLYGEGSGVWTQTYEKKAGQVIYTVTEVDPKTKAEVLHTYAGLTDLTHLEESTAKFSPSGMGNTSLQWIDHAEDALNSGNGQKVAKYLERLEGDLAKGRDMARLGNTGAWRTEIHNLMKGLKDNPNELGKVKDELAVILGKARTEATILSKMGTGTPMRNALLSAMFKSVEDGRELEKALLAASKTVPIERVLDGLMLYMSTIEISCAAGEKDPAAGLIAVAAYLDPLGAALLMQLTNSVLDAAREGGYDLVAGRQEAFDLLAGIYTAVGRVDAEGTEYTVDQLVLRYREGDEAKLRAFVYGLCTKASSRDAGAVTGAADEKVANAMLLRVYPVILRAWQAKRESLMEEFLNLREEYLSHSLRLVCRPNGGKRDPTSKALEVSVTVVPLVGKYQDELTKMRAIMTTLYGTGNFFINITDKWTPTGLPAQMDNQRAFKYERDGTYSIALKRTINTGGTNIPAESPLLTTEELTAGVDLEVGDGIRFTFDPMGDANGNVDTMVITPAVTIERIPGNITKLAYRWSFGELDNNSNTAYEPFQMYQWAPPASTIKITGPAHSYNRKTGWTIRIQLYDASKGMPVMPKPGSTTPSPVPIAEGTQRINLVNKIIWVCT